MKPAPDGMRQEIDKLAKLSRAALAERWHGHYGSPPPKGVKRSLLERSLAWHVQANAFGGIDRRTLRILREAGAQSFSDRYDQPQKPDTDKRPRTPASARPLLSVHV